MYNFKAYYSLLTEAIQKTDIIDLYIILAMPQMVDPAHQFIADEIVKETAGRIINECETVVLDELSYLNDTMTFYNLRDVISNYHDFLSPASAKEFFKKVITQKFKKKKKKKKKTRFNRYGQETYDDEYDFDDEDDFDDRESLQIFKTEIEKPFKKIFNLPDLTPETLKEWTIALVGLIKIGNYLKEVGGEDYDTTENRSITLVQVEKKTGVRMSYNLVTKLFQHLEWEYSYGGKNWAKISEALDNLISAQSSRNFLYYLDRLVDQVHNNGSVLDKFHGFHQGWLVYLLDLKAHAVNIRELIPYASPEVRKLFSTQEWRLATRTMSSQGAESEYTGLTRVLYNFFVPKRDVAELHAGGFLKLITLTKFPTNIIPALNNILKTSTSSEKIKFKKSLKEFLHPQGLFLPAEYIDQRLDAKNKVTYFRNRTGEYEERDETALAAVNIFLDFIKAALPIVGITSKSKANPLNLRYDYTKYGSPKLVNLAYVKNTLGTQLKK